MRFLQQGLRSLANIQKTIPGVHRKYPGAVDPFCHLVACPLMSTSIMFERSIRVTKLDDLLEVPWQKGGN